MRNLGKHGTQAQDEINMTTVTPPFHQKAHCTSGLGIYPASQPASHLPFVFWFYDVNFAFFLKLKLRITFSFKGLLSEKLCSSLVLRHAFILL